MTTPETVFMFCGQGSQYFQMGATLFQRHAVFRRCMHEMDDLVRALCGYSVVELLYERGHTKSETFDRVLLSHPAIFMVQYATAQLLIDNGITPDLTVGTGIGTFAAAAVSDQISMENALLAVVRQASMLEACCVQGGMLAIAHDPRQFSENSVSEDSEIACFNLPKHFVISARLEPLRRIEQQLRASGIELQRLPVPFAFHSKWIDEAQAPFDSFMRSIVCRPGRIRMVCALSARPRTMLPKDYFWRAVREPVRFYDTIQQLEALGSYRYVDVGPSTALSAIVSHGLRGRSMSTVHATLTPFGPDLQNLATILEDIE